jgi:flagellar motor switch protein FliG
VKGVSAEEAETVLKEFHSLLRDTLVYSSPVEGGVEAARRLLYATFGAEKGEAILQKSAGGANGVPFDFLEDFSGPQVALLLRGEGAATVALVLARLTPKLSASALEEMPPDMKPDIIKRLAYMRQSSPEVLKQVSGALREKARRFADAGGKTDAVVDGVDALTAILRHADLSFGDKLLDILGDEDPDLSQNIKERLFTLDDVVQADNKPLQDKLREMSDVDVALLIKGRSDEFAEKILANVSSTRRAIILDEQKYMGPVRRRDVDAIAHDFLDWFRKGRENGKIFLYTDEDVIL